MNPKAVEGFGAHATHIAHLKQVTGATLSAQGDTFGGTAYRAVCGACHTVSDGLHSMAGTTNVRSITFSDGSTTYPYSFVVGSAPTYSGLTGAPSASNPKTCSNASCHFQTTPVWQGY